MGCGGGTKGERIEENGEGRIWGAAAVLALWSAAAERKEKG
jgi:hypothetical protein